jgi:3-hydroxyisobutyrate dehydrogenase-like beta-hydroxyacid dehydrogenase
MAVADGSKVVGLVGLGLVGQALGQRLRAAGWQTVGYDLRDEPCRAFDAAGGTAAASLADVGRRASCVILAVFDTGDVQRVLQGADGLLGPSHGVRTVIDCSTGDPQLLPALAERLRGLGVDFVEAPLSGSSEQIARGEATALLGGEAAAIEACTPVLAAIARHRMHAGAAGMGAKAKLATNLVLGLNRAVFAEGLAYAEAIGFSPDQFLELVLATAARSDAAAIKGPLMVRGDFSPRSRIRQHLKDVELMLAGGRAAGVTLPFSQVHAQLLQAAVDAGDGDLDNAAIVRRLRRPAAS